MQQRGGGGHTRSSKVASVIGHVGIESNWILGFGRFHIYKKEKKETLLGQTTTDRPMLKRNKNTEEHFR